MKHLVNPIIHDLNPYQPGKPIEEIQRKYELKKVIKLASNENPLPIPQRVADAISREVPKINLYPDSDCYYLRQKIAEYNGVGREHVIVGAGSVEIIRMIVGAFLRPGERQTVLSSEKTFLMYKTSAVEMGGKPAYVEAPMGDDYTFDLDALYKLVDDRTKIIFIANPNNPTGTLLPKQELLDFIDKIPEDKIIVLDNAYHEYVSSPENYADGIEEAMNRKNIIVLRTFSKIYSLAGLRVGYGISNPEIISYLNRLKTPFNISRIAQVAALASLESDDFKRRSLHLNSINRKKLLQRLQELGLKVIPSETNFLLFFPPIDTAELNQRLLKEGVIIRPLHAFGVPEGMRVTVGTEEDNDFFIEKLKKVLQYK